MPRMIIKKIHMFTKVSLLLLGVLFFGCNNSKDTPAPTGTNLNNAYLLAGFEEKQWIITDIQDNTNRAYESTFHQQDSCRRDDRLIFYKNKASKRHVGNIPCANEDYEFHSYANWEFVYPDSLVVDFWGIDWRFGYKIVSLTSDSLVLQHDFLVFDTDTIRLRYVYANYSMK